MTTNRGSGNEGPIETKRDIAFETPRGEVAGAPGTSSGTMPQPQDPNADPRQFRAHGTTSRDMTAPRSSFVGGKFGRMFRKLAPWVPPGNGDSEKDANIRALSEIMFEQGREPLDNPAIPSAYTYFGQFVDHDITFDPASSLAKLNDPDQLHNFRTPRFDLDCLYGEGPDDEPFIYDQRADHPGRFLIGSVEGAGELDLPRNSQGTALLGDKRNDENIIVSQLQLTFLLLHNRVLDRVRTEEGLKGMEAFTKAQRVVRFSYQQVVLFDFLPRLCGQEVIDEIVDPNDPGRFNLKFYDPKESAYMPVEFSVAAYRLGHSMIRGGYHLNRIVRGIPIFKRDAGTLEDLRGFRPLPPFWTIDWNLYLDLGGAAADIQPSRKIDSQIARGLKELPPDNSSLAERNLLRGFRMGLPSGQAVARAMGVQELSNAELGIDSKLAGTEAPLWLYILKEAEVGGGERLGPVGARIVAEVFLGLAKHDPQSFINLDPNWSPDRAINGQPLVPLDGGRLQLRDLIRAAGRDSNPFPGQ